MASTSKHPNASKKAANTAAAEFKRVTHELIQLVKQNKPIYDPEDYNHRNFSHLDKLWHQMAAQLNIPGKIKACIL